MKKLLVLLILCGAAMAADTREGKVTADALVVTSSNPVGLNASAALHTLPFKVGLVAGLPVTCTVGERYFASNAITAGQNSYSCTAPNTWTLDFGAGIIVSSGTVDFSGAGHTRPAKVGLIGALPGTCTVGEVYFATDATAGRNWFFCTAPNTWTQQISGGVTSVAMTVPAFMGIAGSPITTSGTLALTMNNQNQNLFLAGPGSGAAATPTFRAIVALDLGTGSATSSTFLRGDLTWAPLAAIAELTSYCTATVGTVNATTYALVPGITSINTTNCTVAVAPQGTPMTRSVTASNFYVTASAAGGAAGSGVMKLLKNGSATTVTCTLGTGTACNDTIHTATYVAGDTWAVTITTGQATDTTANPRVQFEIQ